MSNFDANKTKWTSKATLIIAAVWLGELILSAALISEGLCQPDSRFLSELWNVFKRQYNTCKIKEYTYCFMQNMDKRPLKAAK